MERTILESVMAVLMALFSLKSNSVEIKVGNYIMKKKLLLSIVALLACMQAGAYTCKVNGICYNCNTQNQTATVTYSGYPYNNEYTGHYSDSETLRNKDVVMPSTCTLTVPCGTKDAYIAAGWTTSVFKGGIIETVSPNIAFADANVKALCVANWDTNGDGELSEEEAEAVTDLGTVFKNNTQITSFDELQYFTSLTSIGYHAFYFCEKLTSVTIPNSVKSIGEEAFNFCYGLTSVNIPNSVTNIGEDAFGYCKNLTSITIPQSVTNIGEAAFYGCGKLTTMNVDERNTKYDSRNNCNAIIETSTNVLISGFSTTIIPNSVTSIANYAFAYLNNSSMTSIVIPNSVKKIGKSSFRSCLKLTSVEIPNSVECIGDYAFSSCSGLTFVTIPNSVTSIGHGAFSSCSGLTSVTIPNSVTSIGGAAFTNCKVLASVISEVTEPFSIDNMTFYEISSSCTLTIPYGTKEAYIAAGWTEDVFKGGIVEAPAPVQNINFADANVKALCVANWDTNGDGELSEEEAAAVTSLRSVFKENTTIKSFDELQYFTGLTSIESQSFYSCRSLTSIKIPCNVTTIGESAFLWCKLSSLTIPKSVINIENAAFLDCGISLTTINVEEGNTKYDSRGNCNAIIETATNTLLWGCNSTIIPSSVTSIGNSAFSHCMELSSVSLPDGMTSIGNWAFYNCESLTSIDIPDNVVSIGEDAFWKCDNLTSVNIGINVASIGQWAFSDCSNLHSVISEIEEPFSFGSKAFYGIAPTCTLTVPYGTRDAYIAAGWTENVFKGGIVEAPQAPSPNWQVGQDVTAALGLGDCDGSFSGEWQNKTFQYGRYEISDLGNYWKGEVTPNEYIPNEGNGGVITFYAKPNMDIYQVVKFPAGAYTIKVQSFYREGNPNDTFNNFNKGQTKKNCYLYADVLASEDASSNVQREVSTVIRSMATSEQRTLLYDASDWMRDGSNKITNTDGEEVSVYYPSCTPATLLYFAEGRYWNEMNIVLNEDAWVRLGLRKVASIPEDWLPFSNFQVIYMGDENSYQTENNTLSIPNLNACKGTSVVLPVNLTNTESITAMQFEMSLPAGVTISKCQLTDRKGEDHTASYQKLANGNYQVTVISLSKEVFSGKKGAAVNLTLDVNEGVTVGNHPISLTNIELTTANTQAINPADVSATLMVSNVKIADADGNGKVSITDAVAIVSHILGNDIDGFVAAAADVDGNGRITITDAVAVVDMILRGSASAKKRNFVEDTLDPQ